MESASEFRASQSETDWVVDPDLERLECYRLEAGAFRPLIDAAGKTKLPHPCWEGLVIDLAALW